MVNNSRGHTAVNNLRGHTPVKNSRGHTAVNNSRGYTAIKNPWVHKSAKNSRDHSAVKNSRGSTAVKTCSHIGQKLKGPLSSPKSRGHTASLAGHACDSPRKQKMFISRPLAFDGHCILNEITYSTLWHQFTLFNN